MKSLVNHFSLSRLFCLCLVLSLTACVTTQESVFTKKKSAAKALSLRIQIAITYLQQGDLEKAKENIREAAELDPQSARVHDVYGLIYQTSGESELAEKKFKRMLELDPGYSAGRNNYAAFLFKQKRYQAAIDQLQLVVNDVYYKKRPAAYGNLGLAALELDNYDLARSSFKNAVTISRGEVNPNYFLELALLEYQAKDYPEAAKQLQSYRDKVSQSSAKALLLGINIAEQFKDNNAKASYALALRNLYPRSAEYLRYQQSQQAGAK